MCGRPRPADPRPSSARGRCRRPPPRRARCCPALARSRSRPSQEPPLVAWPLPLAEEPTEPPDCSPEPLVVSVVASLDVEGELLEEVAPLADGVGVDTLAATAWLPGLLAAATQPKPAWRRCWPG